MHPDVQRLAISARMSAEVQQRIPAAAQLVSVSSAGLAAKQERAAERIGPGANDNDMDFEDELINAAYDAFAKHWARDDARGATGADAGCQEACTHSIAAARAKIQSSIRCKVRRLRK